MRRFSLFALTSAVAAITLLVGVAQAAIQELGVSTERPPSSCPEGCQAVVRVSGYQVTQNGSRSNPFRVTRDGKIVAFSIRLGAPSQADRESFTQSFGPSRARLSIVKRGRRAVHRLEAQSEIFNLARYFGSTPTFALNRPLPIQRGEYVALTVPTWVPALSVDRPESEVWRASRLPGQCDDLSQRAAQQRRGGLRRWGCVYRTARLRYSATFVPTPRPTSR